MATLCDVSHTEKRPELQRLPALVAGSCGRVSSFSNHVFPLNIGTRSPRSPLEEPMYKSIAVIVLALGLARLRRRRGAGGRLQICEGGRDRSSGSDRCKTRCRLQLEQRPAGIGDRQLPVSL